MIAPVCDRCHEELDEPGGLAFSPPFRAGFQVKKFHLCKRCWTAFMAWLINIGSTG